jgi:hypothetical protein
MMKTMKETKTHVRRRCDDDKDDEDDEGRRRNDEADRGLQHGLRVLEVAAGGLGLDELGLDGHGEDDSEDYDPEYDEDEDKEDDDGDDDLGLHGGRALEDKLGYMAMAMNL